MGGARQPAGEIQAWLEGKPGRDAEERKQKTEEGHALVRDELVSRAREEQRADRDEHGDTEEEAACAARAGKRVIYQAEEGAERRACERRDDDDRCGSFDREAWKLADPRGDPTDGASGDLQHWRGG